MILALLLLIMINQFGDTKNFIIFAPLIRTYGHLKHG